MKVIKNKCISKSNSVNHISNFIFYFNLNKANFAPQYTNKNCLVLIFLSDQNNFLLKFREQDSLHPNIHSYSISPVLNFLKCLR